MKITVTKLIIIITMIIIIIIIMKSTLSILGLDFSYVEVICILILIYLFKKL